MNPTDLAQVTEKAVVDALMYGTGVILVQNSPTVGIEFVHVHPRDYAELAQSLQFAAQEVKGQMQ